MRRPHTALISVCAAGVLLAGCSSGDGERAQEAPSSSPSPSEVPTEVASEVPSASETSSPEASTTASGTAAPEGERSYCDVVTDQAASRWYGRPVTVKDGTSCMLEEADFLEQDVNVLWSLEEDTRASLADARRSLGVRSDDAERVVLAGGVPAWEVRTSEGHAALIATIVDGDLLFVSAQLTLLHKPYRSMGELVTLARGVAESYTA